VPLLLRHRRTERDVVCEFRQQVITGLAKLPPDMFQGPPNKWRLTVDVVSTLLCYHYELMPVFFLSSQASNTVAQCSLSTLNIRDRRE
jgi:hypothetical protein